jgi:nucleoside-diphosphate-sugar epimerase
MKVLLTGGSGFLGSHVAEALSRGGHQARALVRRSSNVKHLQGLSGVELAFGSIEDAASVARAAEGMDGIIHVAGIVKAKSEDEFRDVNVRGTRNAVEAARAAGVRRFVYVSSLSVAGPSMDGSAVPVGSRNPLTAYARSKLGGEDVVREAKDALHAVILRPTMIYGPRDTESFAFFQSVSRRFLPFLGDGTNKLTVTFGADCADACVAALSADVPSGSTYFIDDGEVYVWRDMLGDIEAAMGKKALVRVSIPFPVVRAAAFFSEMGGKVTGKAVMLTRDKLNELSAPHWVSDSKAAQEELGWAPKVKWAEGTRLAADWYRKSGWL